MEYNDNIMKHIKKDSYNVKHNNYQDYKPKLSKVFNHSCCYCTIFEGENNIGFFHVEHFRPKSKFPNLICNYENLLYSCHKCNVFKKDHWVDDNYDCIKDCNKCKNNICKENDVLRFIDPCREEPSDYIEEKDGLLIEKDSSKIGKYTIELLRLNRRQLIKLRESRRRLFMWLNDQYERREYTKIRLERSKEQFNKLLCLLDRAEIDVQDRLVLEVLNVTLNQKITIYESEIINLDRDIELISGLVYDRRKSIDTF